MNNWISLSQTAGTENAVITVSPDANPSAITRSATIKISNGSITKTVYVSQRAAALAVTSIDIIGHDTYVIPYLGGSATTSNIRFNVRAYYNDGTSRDQVPATITGDTVTASTTMNISDTPETAGTIHAIATFSGKSATTNVTVFQQPVPETNRIAYTASTSILFTNDAINNFGANIIASGYSNGSGTYIFDGQVTKFYGNASCMITPATKGALTEITVPSSIVNLGQSVFNGCSALTSVYGLEYTENVYLPPENSGNDAFRNCTSLTHCGLPHSYTYWSGGAIKADVFYGCSSLTTIIYNGTMAEWNAISKNSNWRRNSAVRYVQCTDGTIDLDPSTDIVYYSPTQLPISASTFTPSADIHTFSNGVGHISSSQGNITKIGDRAFTDFGVTGMPLTYISIPSSVTEIGTTNFVSHVFESSSLTAVTFNGNNLTLIGRGAFQNCESLTAITLPEGVITLYDYCFCDCDTLQDVTIPSTVTSIGTNAFYRSFQLSNINFNGTMAQWQNISKGNLWNYGVPATVVHCSDGDVNI